MDNNWIHQSTLLQKAGDPERYVSRKMKDHGKSKKMGAGNEDTSFKKRDICY